MLTCIEHETSPNPLASVIWMHGLGADGSDFAGIVPQLNLRHSPPIRFVFPNAPSMPVTVNNGYVMPAWYDIYSSNLIQKQDATGIARSAQAICELIEQEVKRGIPYENIALAGFSQGCAMALHTGLLFPKELAGIIALSGYLPLADQFKSQRQLTNQNTPIFLAHGIYDPVVVPERAEESRKLLVELGYQVHWKTYPMEHSVHPQELIDIAEFFNQILKKIVS